MSENNINNGLTAASIGIVYLRAVCEGVEYRLPCTALQYQMSMNALPVAVVYVSMGNELASTSDMQATGNPADLVRALYNRDNKELVHNMLPCWLYEQKTDASGFDKDQMIFHGYISSAGPVYSTAPGGSSMQMYFSCYGLAAALMTSPGGTYIETSMSVALTRYNTNKPVSLETARHSGNLYDGMQYTTDQLLQMPEMQSLRNATIVDKLALCVAAVKLANAWLYDKTGTLKPDPDVKMAFGGETKLKTSGNGLQPECDEAYTKQLLDLFMTRMSGSGIMGCIQTLPSDTFMLDYIPRWRCDAESEDEYDFKTELCPCTAWKPRRTIQLTADEVTSFRMQHDSFGVLNTPDVVLVSFNELLAFDNNLMTLDTGIIGAAARTASLQTKLRDACRGQNLASINEDTAMYRVREFATPRWLGIIAPNEKVTSQNNRDNTHSLALEHTPERTSDETGGLADFANQPTLIKSGKDDAWSAADAIAETLFQRMYLAGDTATLEILPAYRFGKYKSQNIFFENSLGDTVEVDLSNAVGDMYDKSRLKVRGVLQSVSYQYAAGQASTAKYMITLTRVRLVNDKEAQTVSTGETHVTETACPIYTVGEPHDG